METLREDPDLAAEMVALMAKQLRALRQGAADLKHELVEERKRVADLEGSLKSQQERAESAELSVGIVESNLEQLRREVELEKQLKKELESSSLESIDTKIEPKEEIELWPEAQKNDVRQLREALEDQQETARSLKEICEELDQRVMQLESEKEELLQRLESSSSSHGFPPAIGRKRLGSYNSRGSDFKALACQLAPPGRPAFDTLSPIQDGDVDLETYLTQCLEVFDLPEILYFPGRMKWLQEKTHATAYGPTNIFDADADLWKKSTRFSSLQGQTRELFFRRDKSIYYAGTYKCHQACEYFSTSTDASTFPEGISSWAISRASMEGGPRWRLHDETLRKLFSDGMMTVESMGLECVGFNQELYKVLLQHRSVNVHPKRKGPENPATNRGGKKPKLDDHA